MADPQNTKLGKALQTLLDHAPMTAIAARACCDNLRTRIAELEAERDGLRAALEAISSPCYVSIDDCPDHDQPNGWRALAVARVDIARQALGAKP